MIFPEVLTVNRNVQGSTVAVTQTECTVCVFVCVYTVGVCVSPVFNPEQTLLSVVSVSFLIQGLNKSVE